MVSALWQKYIPFIMLSTRDRNSCLDCLHLWQWGVKLYSNSNFGNVVLAPRKAVRQSLEVLLSIKVVMCMLGCKVC